MKKAAWLLLVVWLMTGCNIKRKDDDPTPAAPDIAGTYQLSYFSGGGVTANLPRTFTSNGVTIVQTATAEVAKNSDTQITATLRVLNNGQVASTDVLNYSIQRNGDRYDLLTGSTRTGYVDGVNFSLDYIEADGSRTVVTARK